MAESIAAMEQAYTAALRAGDADAARAVVARARAAGVALAEIYLRIFTPSMVAIGRLWERNELTIAEEHLATAITEGLIGELSPSFAQALAGSGGTALIGCVEGERHALGARMLADLFRDQGWRVLYLGADVPTADWVKLAVRYQADLVAISAGMRLHLPAARALVAQLRASLPGLAILVGGGAFDGSPGLWRDLGADLYHADPGTAVALAGVHARR